MRNKGARKKGNRSTCSPSLDELTDRAEALEDTGSTTEALEAWRKALEHYTTPYLLYRFGRLAGQMMQLREAERTLLSAIGLAPGFPAPYTALGILYLERGDYESAEALLKRGLEVEESAQAYTLLGVSQRRRGMMTRARDSFCKAIKVDRDYEEAYYNLGITQQRTAQAVALLRRSLDLDPEYQAAHRELGWALRQLEDFAQAEDHLRKAIELDDSDGWAYVYLGNLMWAKRDFAAAEELFKKAGDVWPDDSLTHWCLAIFYEYQGRAKEADFFYEKALELDPDDAETNLRFGLFLKQLGQNAKARAHVERALNSEPENEYARSVLCEIDDSDSTRPRQPPN